MGQFNVAALHDVVSAAAGIPIDGVAVLGPVDPTEPITWHVITVATRRVRIDYPASATTLQIAAGDAAAQAFGLARRRPRPDGAVEADVLAWIAAGATQTIQVQRTARAAARALDILARLGQSLGANVPVAGDELDT